MYISLDRTVVRLSGADRTAFLQNFCTADVKQMETGQIREAFVLGTKGKLVGHVLLFVHAEWIDLDTVSDQASALIEHLDRYLIREDVELQEQNVESLFCFGDTEKLQQSFAIELDQFETRDGIQLANCEAAGRGILLSGADGQALQAFAQSQGQEVATDEQLQWHRVLAGTPWFGIDSTTDTLPQELQRDDKAISFTKGCYLGQETVARIDALGRVNKLLVRLKAKKPISVGQSLEFGEKEVGKISSVATNGEEFMALAIVRRAATTKGSVLNEATTAIEVI